MSEKGIIADGDLNYILFAFCKYCIPKSYNSIKNFRAELLEASDEIREKLLKPHEKVKEEENGRI